MGILPIIFYESITGYFPPTLDALALQLLQELRSSTSATKDKCSYHRSLFVTLPSHLPPNAG